MDLKVLPLLQRFACALLVLCLCVIAHAQSTTLTPMWMQNGWTSVYNPPQYSWAGTNVLIWSISEIEVYSAATGKVTAKIQVDQLNGEITGACLTASGNGVLYAVGHNSKYTVLFDKFSGGVQTALNISETEPIRMLSPSRNGLTLAYLVTDSSNGSDRVCIYNLSTNTSTVKFDYYNPGANKGSTSDNTTGSIGFVDSDKEVVLSGPTIYDFTGKQISVVSNEYEPPVTVSPDETKLYSYNAADSLFHGYSVSGLTSLWTLPTSGTAIDFETLQVSSDNKSVLVMSEDMANWYLMSVNASTGKALSSQIQLPAPNTSYDYVWMTASPTSNQVLIGPNTAGSSCFLWDFSSSTGAGTSLGVFFSGNDVNSAGYVPQFLNGSTTVGSSTTPTVTTSLWPSTVSTINALTGATLSSFTSIITSPLSISPTGQYFLQTSGATAEVNSYPGNSEVTSLTLPDSLTNKYGWGGTGSATRFVVSDLNNAYVCSFTASKISQLAKIPTLDGVFELSPDGTKIAVLVNNSGVLAIAVYNAGNGTPLFTIDQDTNSYTGIDDVSLTNASANEIGVHEVTATTSSSSGATTYVSEYRVFNMGSNPPALVSKMTYTLPANATSISANLADGVLSPDGLTVAMGGSTPSTAADPRAMGTVRLYAAATGAQLSEWDNQFIPDSSEPYGFYLTPTFDFSLDGSTVIWSSQNQLVGAPTSADKLTVALTSSTVSGGTSTTGTVTISPKPASATTIVLSSSSSSVTVPSKVTIAANSSSATFTATTVGVASSTTATVTAILVNASSSAALTVTPASSIGVTFSPSTVNAGTSSKGTLTLNAEVGPSGLVVRLSSANSAVVGVPSTVTVPANKTSVTFTATTAQPTSTGPIAVTATVGTITGSASLTVTRTAALEASFNQASITGGGAVLLTLSLDAPAPTGGTVVTLTSNNSALQPRSTATIPAGATSVSIGVGTNAVLTNTSTVLTASVKGGSATATESVLAPILQTVTPDTAFVVGGGSTHATVQLSGVAPAGLKVACSSGNAAVVVPASFMFPTGSASAEVPITTKTVTAPTAVTVLVGGLGFKITVYP